MVSKKDGKIVLWPAYFDINLARDEGRRVSKNLAVPSPSIQVLERICSSLGLNPIIEEKAYPGRWHGQRGRILVDKKESKARTVMRVAEKLRT